MARSKLMGFKEFLASPDFARLQESKAPRGSVPSSASDSAARSKIMGFTEFVGSPEFEHPGREALSLKKDPLKDRKTIEPATVTAARAIRSASAVTAALAQWKKLLELNHEFPFSSSLVEQAAYREKLMALAEV